MNRLIIVGAGGFGREVLNWALHAEAGQQDWRVAGFLDGNPRALEGYDYPFAILGDPKTHRPDAGECFLCAIGEPRIKLAVCQALEQAGARFVSLVHPSAVVGRTVVLGPGCIICPGAVVTADVRLGRHVAVNACASIGHDVVIGDGCTLSGHADVTGFAMLGQGVFLGSHAVILPKAKVGDFAIVGAGSVVLRSVKPGATVMGVPAIQVAGFQSGAEKAEP
ncbi:MAG: acetyltransferase [Desulfobacteraceae bacterium]|nr:acetyltransferase [Desulfobacteraceae bacterium]